MRDYECADCEATRQDSNGEDRNEIRKKLMSRSTKTNTD